jgi:L-ornithine Nalpha-acyltransferase
MSGVAPVAYRARFAASAADLSCAQALRGRRFRSAGGPDGDAFDAAARHVLVEDRGGRVVCTFRLTAFPHGRNIAASYAAQFYDLGRLARWPGPMLEMGRFCIERETTDPAVLRVAWGALADLVAAEGVGLVFGCASFAGAGAEAHSEALALLKERHLAPRRWLPRVKAAEVDRFARRLRLRAADMAAATRAMPPLLRSYLAMGGWVSDHAVVDRELDTLHVFTGLEVAAIPKARLRALRAAKA